MCGWRNSFGKAIIVLLFGFIAAPSSAVNVSDGNQLYIALLDAGDLDSGSFEIRLLGRVNNVPTRFKRTPITQIDGPYSFSLNINRNFTQNQEIVISGGWDSTFTTRSNNPGDSILDGETTHALLRIFVQTDAAPSIILKNLTFRDGVMPAGEQSGIVNVSVNGTATTPFIWMDRVIVKYNDNRNDVFGSAINIVAANTATPIIALTNSQLLENASVNDAALFILSSGGTSRFYVLNNTIVGNTVTTLNTSAGLRVDSPSSSTDTLYVYNNIIYGNTAASNTSADVYIATGYPFQISQGFHNHIGAKFGSFGSTLRETSGVANLGWTTFPTYHFYPKSCFLLNSGATWPASFGVDIANSSAAQDLLGFPRVQGKAVDRGAVEMDMSDFVFCNDFEAN